MARAGFGYNSTRFFAGINGVFDVYNLPLGKSEFISYSVGSASAYLGFHFNLPKSISKYTDKMKKSNKKVSQHKIKRAVKNKKRIQAKPYLSKFEQRQNRIREEIVLGSLRSVPN